eukprot:XP_014789619.1 PREDICTED: galanin receptor type 1-like [Octopus bimaculoides]
MNLTAGEYSDIYQGGMYDYSYDLYFYEDLEKLRLPGVQESYFCLTVTVYSLTFLLGLLGNSLVIFAVCGDRKPRSVTSLFMVSLAVADLMFILVCTPYELVRYFKPHAEGGAPVCKLASFVDMLSAVASILNLTSISVERFCVASPFMGEAENIGNVQSQTGSYAAVTGRNLSAELLQIRDLEVGNKDF